MSRLLYIIRLFCLLLLASAVSRAIFIVYNLPLVKGEAAGTILLSFYYGLKMDISTACYVLAFPVILMLIQALTGRIPIDNVLKWYMAMIFFLNSLITSAELAIYDAWGIKMHYKALLYLKRPSEVFLTASNGQIILGLTLTIIQTAVAYFIYSRFVQTKDTFRDQRRLASIAVSLILLPVLFLGMRGGWQQIPVQAGDAYYSDNIHLNWAAVNSMWSLGQSIVWGMTYSTEPHYHFYADEDARETADALCRTRSDSTVFFVTTPRPNIVLVIFEGWSADLIESISKNKEHSCAPHFDSLVRQGLLFSQCLASGERSDQGVTTVLTSFPSLPLASVINYPEKINHLPSMLGSLKGEGYSSLFLFGGQLSYGNLKALIYQNKFDRVIEDKDIDPAIMRGRLGVHDQFTFDIFRRELHTMKEPFLSAIFTQSTHSSYDYPKPKKTIAWAGSENDYINSLQYADSCLGDFFEKAKKESWYANTLFILVSDHSHVLPWDNDHRTSAIHHIPLLFYGDVIREEFRGVERSGVVSQQDICATVLSQMHLGHQAFRWSKDVMNPATPSYAYWTFTEGFGFTRSAGCEMIYDAGSKSYSSSLSSGCDSARLRRDGCSYMQSVFTDFLSR